jgi:hypothetical protein
MDVLFQGIVKATELYMFSSVHKSNLLSFLIESRFFLSKSGVAHFHSRKTEVYLSFVSTTTKEKKAMPPTLKQLLDLQDACLG